MAPTTKIVELAQIDHIGVRVSASGPALDFYRQFGFEKTLEDEKMHIINLQNDAGVELNLEVTSDTVPGDNILMDMTELYPGYTHIALRISSLEKTREQLAALDIPVVRGPIHYPDGSSVFVRDPDGNVLELRSRENIA